MSWDLKNYFTFLCKFYNICRFYDKRRCKQDVLLEEITCNNLCSNNITHRDSIASSESGQMSSPDILISHGDDGVSLNIN